MVEQAVSDTTLFIRREWIMIKDKMFSSNIFVRIATLFCVFMFLFFGMTILSYFLLPEKVLLNKNSLTDFQTSNNLLIGAMQIFLWNLIAVVFIIIGSMFAHEKNNIYVSYGYTAFIINVVINAITLGTDSFANGPIDAPLFERLILTFDITHHAGLVEMLGQLLISCSFATTPLMITVDKTTTVKKIRDLNMQKKEIYTAILGILLMFAGAIIENRAILAN